jgi:hypothetical protein
MTRVGGKTWGVRWRERQAHHPATHGVALHQLVGCGRPCSHSNRLAPARSCQLQQATHMLQRGACLHLEAHTRAANGALVIPLVRGGQGVDAVSAHIPARAGQWKQYNAVG